MKLWKILRDSELFSNIGAEEFRTKYESRIIFETLDHLSKYLPNIYDLFDVVILLNNGLDIKNWGPIGLNDKRRIYIVFDEKGRLPSELLDGTNDVVFHAHLNFDESARRYSNLFHYPLGCNSFVPELPYVSPSHRKINVFFSGNLHVGRKGLYQQLSHLHRLPFSVLSRVQKYLNTTFDAKFSNSYIRFTEGFSKGLSFESYADYLCGSKILLSPPGISNPECFRHYEGLRAGCVVITERLPTKPQYIGSPIIEVGDWLSGFRIIRELLKNPAELDQLSRNSYKWYHEKLAPEPTAQYVFHKIQGLQARS